MSGNNNVAAGRDVHIVAGTVMYKQKLLVRLDSPMVSEDQKARLLELRDHWVALHNVTTRAGPLTFQAAQKAINTKAGVRSYHLIPATRYQVLERWLLEQIGRCVVRW